MYSTIAVFVWLCLFLLVVHFAYKYNMNNYVSFLLNVMMGSIVTQVILKINS